MFRKKPGFTLAEIVTVIVVITALITISMAYFTTARRVGRDTQRLADIKNIQASLENYRRQEGHYPDQLGAAGTNLYSSSSNITYLTSIPSNPSPRTGGNCPDRDYLYLKNGNYDNYFLSFCLEEKNGAYSKGLNIESASGVVNEEKVDAGLVSYWKMNEYDSAINNLTIPDYGPGNHDFTISDPGQRWESDHFGYSVHFQNSSISLGNLSEMNFTDSFSVSLWTEEYSDGVLPTMALISKYNTGNGWDFTLNNSRPAVGLRGNPENFHLATSSPQIYRPRDDQDEWHHLVAVSTLNESKIYLDGKLISVKEGPWGPITNSVDFLIGGRSGAWPLRADLGEIRIYNRPLNDAEVAWLYFSKKTNN